MIEEELDRCERHGEVVGRGFVSKREVDKLNKRNWKKYQCRFYYSRYFQIKQISGLMMLLKPPGQENRSKVSFAVVADRSPRTPRLIHKETEQNREALFPQFANGSVPLLKSIHSCVEICSRVVRRLTATYG